MVMSVLSADDDSGEKWKWFRMTIFLCDEPYGVMMQSFGARVECGDKSNQSKTACTRYRIATAQTPSAILMTLPTTNIGVTPFRVKTSPTILDRSQLSSLDLPFLRCPTVTWVPLQMQWSIQLQQRTQRSNRMMSWQILMMRKRNKYRLRRPLIG